MIPIASWSLAFSCTMLPLGTMPKSSAGAAATPAAVAKASPKGHAIGNVTGQVVSLTDSVITLKVTEIIAKPPRVNPLHPTTVPHTKPQVKHVDVKYNLAESVTVKTIGGKAADQSLIKVGDTVQVHLSDVKQKVGEKTEHAVVVSKIDIPNSAVPAPKK